MADEIVIVPVADHLFSRDTLAAAGQLAKAAPERLTELHLAHLAHYVTPRALADLVTRRRQAAEAAEAAGWDAYNAGFRAAHGVHTGAVQPLTAKSAPTVPAIDDAPIETVAQFADLLDRHPDVPVTAGLLATFVRFADAMNEKNKERNVKIAALETRAAAADQRSADLELRLKSVQLELEADRVVRR